jgi:DnaJ family protein C protein 3
MRKAQKLQRQASRKDYYKILEVPRDADERQIKKAYRRKAMEFHPDRYKGDKEYAEKKMAEINQAYEVLGNAELRQRFDHGDDPNDPTGGHGGHGHPFGSHVVFQQGGPFGFGGGSDQFFQFHFG